MTSGLLREEYIARSMVRGRRPRTLGEYLTWFSEQWHAEQPSGALHGRAVWSDRVTTIEQDDGLAPLGGSRLGSRALAAPFRRLLENSPFETEYARLDGVEAPNPHYVRPIHAAIARLGHRYPLGSRWLSALAARDFDWRALVERRGWSVEEGELYLVSLLSVLWREYDEAPRARATI